MCGIIYDAAIFYNEHSDLRGNAGDLLAEDEVPARLRGFVLWAKRDSLAFTEDEGAHEANQRSRD